MKLNKWQRRIMLTGFALAALELVMLAPITSLDQTQRKNYDTREGRAEINVTRLAIKVFGIVAVTAGITWVLGIRKPDDD